MTRETKSSFARRLGVSPSYVTKLVQEGRLVVAEGQIEVEASLARMNATKDPNRDDVRQRFAKQRDEKRKEAATPISPVAAGVNKDAGEKTASRGQKTEAEGMSDGKLNVVEGFGEMERRAKAAILEYKRRGEETELAFKQGKLIKIIEIVGCAESDGALLRSMLENLPDQAAPRLAPIRDLSGVTTILGDLMDDVTATRSGLMTKNIAAMREAGRHE
jgi:hypothetical protein